MTDYMPRLIPDDTWTLYPAKQVTALNSTIPDAAYIAARPLTGSTTPDLVLLSTNWWRRAHRDFYLSDSEFAAFERLLKRPRQVDERMRNFVRGL